MFQRKPSPSTGGAGFLPAVVILLLLAQIANPFEISSSAVVIAGVRPSRVSKQEHQKQGGKTTDNCHELSKPSSGDDAPQVNNIPNGWPVQGHITSRFGTRRMGRRAEFHPGLDIAVPVGTEVDATANGEVVFAARQSGYGNLVVIDHGNGMTTRYGHLSEITVTAGQQMNRGAAVGLSGSTGRSTGPHVHYEVRENGVPVNPMKSSGP